MKFRNFHSTDFVGALSHLVFEQGVEMYRISLASVRDYNDNPLSQPGKKVTVDSQIHDLTTSAILILYFSEEPSFLTRPSSISYT